MLKLPETEQPRIVLSRDEISEETASQAAEARRRRRALSADLRRRRNQSRTHNSRFAKLFSEGMCVAGLLALAYFGAFISAFTECDLLGIPPSLISLEINNLIASGFLTVLPAAAIGIMFIHFWRYVELKRLRTQLGLIRRIGKADVTAVDPALRGARNRRIESWVCAAVGVATLGWIVWTDGWVGFALYIALIASMVWVLRLVVRGVTLLKAGQLALAGILLIGLVNAEFTARIVHNRERWEVLAASSDSPERVILIKSGDNWVVSELNRSEHTFGPGYSTVPIAQTSWKSEEVGRLTPTAK